MNTENHQQPMSSLRSKLLTVGLSGVVFVGGTLGLSTLASAQSASDPLNADQATEVQADDGNDPQEHSELSFFDGMTDADQAVIEGFESCLDDAGLLDLEGFAEEVEVGDLDELEGTDVVMAVEINADELDEIEAVFEACEPILDELSFEAGEWLEGETAVVDGGNFEGCVIVEGDLEDAIDLEESGS